MEHMKRHCRNEVPYVAYCAPRAILRPCERDLDSGRAQERGQGRAQERGQERAQSRQNLGEGRGQGPVREELVQAVQEGPEEEELGQEQGPERPVGGNPGWGTKWCNGLFLF